MIGTKDRTTPLIGIIPAYYLRPDYDFDWDPLMMPIGPSYYLYEHAVEQCAAFGVDIIYVVGNLFIQNMIKKNFGQYVVDPIAIMRNYSTTKQYLKQLKQKSNIQSFFSKKKSCFDLIPIIYQPVFLPFRVQEPFQNQFLAAVYSSYCVSDSFLSVSQAYKSVRFLVSFPQTITPVSGFLESEETLKTFLEYRDHFQSNGNIFWKTTSKSIFDGDEICFSFDSTEVENLRNIYFGMVEKSQRSKKQVDVSIKNLMKDWNVIQRGNYKPCFADYSFNLLKWGEYSSYIKVQKEKNDLISLGVQVKYPSEFKLGIGFDEKKNKKFGSPVFVASSFDRLFGGL